MKGGDLFEAIMARLDALSDEPELTGFYFVEDGVMYFRGEHQGLCAVMPTDWTADDIIEMAGTLAQLDMENLEAVPKAVDSMSKRKEMLN